MSAAAACSRRTSSCRSFPIVDSYRAQYSYFVDEHHPEHKGPWNALHSVARVYAPEDEAMQTPNSDTPYGFLGADLRAEPHSGGARNAASIRARPTGT